MPEWLRRFAHWSGLIASPGLAFMGAPFGPRRRDMAGEVMASIARSHNAAMCLLCSGPVGEPA